MLSIGAWDSNMQCVSVITLCFLKAIVSEGYDWDKFMPRGQGFPVLEYVYYTQQMTWNDARSTCTSIGGDLVTIDSEGTLDAIDMTINEYYSTISTDLFFGDYWVGLTEVLKGASFWAANCSILSYHEIFNTTWDARKMCFYMSGTTNRGLRMECDSLHPFMCERELVDKCTSFITLMNVEYVTTVEDACDQVCLYDTRCIGTILVTPLICHVIYKTGTNSTFNGQLSIKAKSCINIQINSTQSTDVSNGDLVPAVDCDFDRFLVNDTISNTSSTPIDSASVASTNPTPSSSPSPNLLANGVFDTTALLSTHTLTSGQSEISTTGALGVSNDSACACSSDTVNISSNITSSPACVHENQSSTIKLQTQSGETYICNKLNPSNLTVNEIEEKAEEISQNLTIPTKETSAYLRTLTSAEDKRTSSVVMGTVGIVCVTVPVALLVLSDVKLLYDTLITGHSGNKIVTHHAKRNYFGTPK